MKRRRLVLSDAAATDILEQADWYAAQAGKTISRRWEKAVTSAVLRVADRPGSGLPCRFRPPGLLGIRRVLVPGFPKHLVFYQYNKEAVHVLRVIHGARDLERLF